MSRYWLAISLILTIGLPTTNTAAFTQPIIAFEQGNCPPGETEVIIWPTLQTISSTTPHAGDPIVIQGSGGFIQCSGGLYNESARSFVVTLDAQPIGQLGCYANYCQTTLTIPLTTSSGVHLIATEGGSQMSIIVQPQRATQGIQFLPMLIQGAIE
ncbi:hypothetical protein Haur_1914 [Herpetosiphon aurantiacus DSM 785]|uniref:IPT/TIG domain-containing protein n=1 Tax=Herpetosiphon aurantiacus (strain ATCC 23779 / DSM 785 / 114-95) TaxID=316274 RepID=A9AUN0_HERA2|nr:hypothetical protein Haur_1914 [Herpetosiphon aurantiacus DSM 785]